jgi:hypothetical protein
MRFVTTHDESRKYLNLCKLSRLTRIKLRCFHESRFRAFQDFFFTWRWVFCNRSFLLRSNFVVFAWVLIFKRTRRLLLRIEWLLRRIEELLRVIEELLRVIEELLRMIEELLRVIEELLRRIIRILRRIVWAWSKIEWFLRSRIKRW